MESKRKVMVSEYLQAPDNIWFLEEKGEAVFHQFGCDYTDNGESMVGYSTAIVEYADGTVGNVPVEMIRFLSEQ